MSLKKQAQVHDIGISGPQMPPQNRDEPIWMHNGVTTVTCGVNSIPSLPGDDK